MRLFGRAMSFCSRSARPREPPASPGNAFFHCARPVAAPADSPRNNSGPKITFGHRADLCRRTRNGNHARVAVKRCAGAESPMPSIISVRTALPVPNFPEPTIPAPAGRPLSGRSAKSKASPVSGTSDPMNPASGFPDSIVRKRITEFDTGHAGMELASAQRRPESARD